MTMANPTSCGFRARTAESGEDASGTFGTRKRQPLPLVHDALSDASGGDIFNKKKPVGVRAGHPLAQTCRQRWTVGEFCTVLQDDGTLLRGQ